MSGRNVKEEKKRIMMIAAAMIVAGLACSILTVVAYDRFFAQKVIAVDLAGFVARQRDRFVSGEITAPELVDNIDGILRRMGERSGKDIIVLDGVVSGKVERLGPGPDGEHEMLRHRPGKQEGGDVRPIDRI